VLQVGYLLERTKGGRDVGRIGGAWNGIRILSFAGFVINRLRFWGFCERVNCVKTRLVICGRIARATSSGRSEGRYSREFAASTGGRLYCGDDGLVCCLDGSLVHYIGTVECID
jgi:hypothetical protein